MSDEKMFRIKAKKWLLPETKPSNKILIKAKVGDLLMVGNRLCLVLEILEHEDEWKKRALVQWAGETETYWINYNTFLDLIDGEKNG
jgi:hypothetical protein